MEGFNNLEQGLLIACAIASTGSIFWLALVMSSASLRTIGIESALKRISQALESPPVEISESAESIARRMREEQERKASASPNVVNTQTFGNMTDEERAAKRRERRIAHCKHYDELASNIPVGATTVSCPSCGGTAQVLRDGQGTAYLGEFK